MLEVIGLENWIQIYLDKGLHSLSALVDYQTTYFLLHFIQPVLAVGCDSC